METGRQGDHGQEWSLTVGVQRGLGGVWGSRGGIQGLGDGQESESPGGGGTHQGDQLWGQGKPGQMQGILENSTCGSCGPGVPAGPALPSPPLA